MAVGILRAVTIDVNDLEVGERFWAELTGLPVTVRGWNAQYSRLGTVGPGSILLQLVPERKGELKNRMHLDFTVEDLEGAVEHVLALGGALVGGPWSYPDTGTPYRQFTVMADPFGNEFCLVRELVPDADIPPTA